MDEKALYEFSHDGLVYRIIEGEDGVPHAISMLNGVQIFGLAAAGWKRASITEILQLAAENAELKELLDRAMSSAESAGSRARAEGLLEEVHSALDSGLGDTDMDDYESEDEMRDYAPIQWAAMKIAQALHREEDRL